MVKRAAWLSTVLSYVGTPYHLHGRKPGVGMDCPAPLICAAWEHGIKPRDWDVTGYAADPDGVSLRKLCDENLEPITLDKAQPGDVILAAWTRERMRPRHLGVLIDANPKRRYWVQAEGFRHKKVILGRLMFGSDGMQLVQAYRVPGVACS